MSFVKYSPNGDQVGKFVKHVPQPVPCMVINFCGGNAVKFPNWESIRNKFHFDYEDNIAPEGKDYFTAYEPSSVLFYFNSEDNQIGLFFSSVNNKEKYGLRWHKTKQKFEATIKNIDDFLDQWDIFHRLPGSIQNSSTTKRISVSIPLRWDNTHYLVTASLDEASLAEEVSE